MTTTETQGSGGFHPKTKEDVILHDQEKIKQSLMLQGMTLQLAEWLSMEYASGQRTKQRVIELEERVRALEGL